MSKPLTTALAQFAAATTGRNITKAAYVAVTAGVLSMVLLTDKRADEAHDSVSGLLWTCLAYFVFEGLSGCTLVIRKGTQGDCRYFIAAGEVELDLPGKTVQLGEGAFFGEMALLGNNLRGANVSTTKVSRLLVLDLVDFRVLMAASRSRQDHRRRGETARTR